MLEPTTLQIAKVGCPCRFISQGRQRVGRLAALCDRKHQGVVVDRRIAIRSSLAYSTSTGSRANSSSRYSPTNAECQLVPQAVRKCGRRSAIVAAIGLTRRNARSPRPPTDAPHGVAQGLGLLEDLLEHEMVVAAQVDVSGLQIQSLHAVMHLSLVAMDDAKVSAVTTAISCSAR